jgi:NAD(P)H dehydrogenase (quinone)
MAALVAADPADPVRAVVRDPSRAAGQLPVHVEVRHGDFARPDSLPDAFASARAVLLLCGHDRDQLALERAGLAAAVRAGVPRVVYVSAAGAGADPVPPLAADHRRVEDELAAVPGLGWVVLRPTAAFPSLLGGLRRLITPDGAVPLAFGGARVDLIDARDVGAAAAVVLRTDAHDGQVFTLTGPERFTGAELVETLAAASSRSLSYLDLTPDDLAAQLRAAGAPASLVDHLAELFGYFRAGGLDVHTDDVARLTGAQPRTLRDWLHGPGATVLTPAH